MAAKKKSKLQKRKDNPDSKYWRIRADKLWSKIVRRPGVCAVCGSKKFLQAHHQIPKKGNRDKRYCIENGICLCSKHHKFSFQMSAHKCSLVFAIWVLEHRPEQWMWVADNCEKELKILTYRAEYQKLLKISKQLGIIE